MNQYINSSAKYCIWLDVANVPLYNIACIITTLLSPDGLDLVMATRAPEVDAIESYGCPSCDGTVRHSGGLWECTDCGYAPRHGAD